MQQNLFRFLIIKEGVDKRIYMMPVQPQTSCSCSMTQTSLELVHFLTSFSLLRTLTTFFGAVHTPRNKRDKLANKVCVYRSHCGTVCWQWSNSTLIETLIQAIITQYDLDWLHIIKMMQSLTASRVTSYFVLIYLEKQACLIHQNCCITVFLTEGDDIFIYKYNIHTNGGAEKLTWVMPETVCIQTHS